MSVDLKDGGRLQLFGDGVSWSKVPLAVPSTLGGTALGELRAATSLAQLWGDNGGRGRARELLAPLYEAFTEGFDTPDLRDAKALLDALA